MKKALIICSVIASVLISVGIVLLIIGGTFWRGNTNYTVEVFNSEQTVERLNLSVAAGSTKVEFYEGDSVEIKYEYNSRLGFAVSEENGTVKLHQIKTGWIGLWGINARRAPAATVKIPTGLVADLTIHIGAGTVTVADGAFGDVKCNVSAGVLDMGKTDCSSFICEVSAGSFNIDGVSCDSIDCDVSAGSARFSKVACGKIDIDVSAGSASFGILGDEAEYNISVDKSAGSCNVTSHQRPDASKRINIDVSAGSVFVNFN